MDHVKEFKKLLKKVTGKVVEIRIYEKRIYPHDPRFFKGRS